jgi:hypothetical protein
MRLTPKTAQEQPLTKAAKKRKEEHIEPTKKDETIDHLGEKGGRLSDQTAPAS